MNEKKPDGGPQPEADAGQEGFLRRWARLKEASRQGVDAEAAAGLVPEEKPAAPAPVEAAEPPEPQAPLGDEDMPPLESLGEDSDYSAFMSPGVSPDLRQKALRQLFRSPKFNITDGLDDYCEDFTKWRPLGDIVTADMKYHMERKLREQLEKAARSGETGEPVEAAGADGPAPGAVADTDTATDTDIDTTGEPPVQGDKPNEPGNA